MSDQLLKGVGEIALAGRIIENPTDFQIQVEYEDDELRNLGSKERGIYKSSKTISKISWEATIHDFSAESQAQLLSGLVSENAAGAVTDEAVTARQGMLVPVAKMVDLSVAATVTDNAGSHATDTALALNTVIKEGTNHYRVKVAGTTASVKPTFTTDGSDVVDGTVTWEDVGVFAAVSGTDFTMSAAGLRVVSGQGIPDYCPVLVSYTSLLSDRVEIGAKVLDDIEVVFDGYNTEKSVNGEIVGRFYKNSIAGDALQLISESFGELKLTGTVNLDTSKPAGQRYGYLYVGKTQVV